MARDDFKMNQNGAMPCPFIWSSENDNELIKLVKWRLSRGCDEMTSRHSRQ